MILTNMVQKGQFAEAEARAEAEQIRLDCLLPVAVARETWQKAVNERGWFDGRLWQEEQEAYLKACEVAEQNGIQWPERGLGTANETESLRDRYSKCVGLLKEAQQFLLEVEGMMERFVAATNSLVENGKTSCVCKDCGAPHTTPRAVWRCGNPHGTGTSPPVSAIHRFARRMNERYPEIKETIGEVVEYLLQRFRWGGCGGVVIPATERARATLMLFGGTANNN